LKQKFRRLLIQTLKGFPLEASKEEFLEMEKRKRKILEDREATWRLKSRALWLESGDENTKFFQAYAKGRKTANTIWSLQDQSQREITSFEGLAHPWKITFP
jgi:hypothetical protein